MKFYSKLIFNIMKFYINFSFEVLIKFIFENFLL